MASQQTIGEDKRVRNNLVLKRISTIFKLEPHKLIDVFQLAEVSIKESQLEGWLKNENDPEYQPCLDIDLAGFLNGFINDARGKKEGKAAKVEHTLSNNMILRKLNIALDLQAEDVLDIFESVELTLSKHELSAFFRKPGHKHYRACEEQTLIRYLKALELKFGE